MSRMYFNNAVNLMNLVNTIVRIDNKVSVINATYKSAVEPHNKELEELEKKFAEIEKTSGYNAAVNATATATREHETAIKAARKAKTDAIKELQTERQAVVDVLDKWGLYDSYKYGVSVGSFGKTPKDGQTVSFRDAVLEMCFETGVKGAHHSACINALITWIGARVNRKSFTVTAKGKSAFTTDFLYAFASYALMSKDWVQNEDGTISIKK